MPLKKCPNCGMPVAGYTKCPFCGKDLLEEEGQQSVRPRNKKITVGQIQLSPWEAGFLLVANLSLICILINAITGGTFWALYVSLTLGLIYLLAFTIASQSAQKFITRFRNLIFLINAILFICLFVSKMIDSTVVYPLVCYYVPASLIVGNIVCLLFLLNPNIGIRQIQHCILAFFVQSSTLLLFMATKAVPVSELTKILFLVSVGVNLLSTVNLIALRVIRVRSNVHNAFKFWE